MIDFDKILEEKTNKYNFLNQTIKEKNISLQAVIDEATREIKELEDEQLRLQGEYRAISEIQELQSKEDMSEVQCDTQEPKKRKNKSKDSVVLEEV